MKIMEDWKNASIAGTSIATNNEDVIGKKAS
jgi:hypothetical protein